MTEDLEQLTAHPYELRVCSADMNVTPLWDNFCDHVRKQMTHPRQIMHVREMVDQGLSEFGAINPLGDYIRFKTAEQRTWFVLKFA
jgi:hypothetical protein